MDDAAERLPSRLTLPVDMGRRVAVLANVLLAPEVTAATGWAAAALARVLDEWDGPGTVVVAGNLLDLRPPYCRPGASPQHAVPAGTLSAPSAEGSAPSAEGEAGTGTDQGTGTKRGTGTDQGTGTGTATRTGDSTAAEDPASASGERVRAALAAYPALADALVRFTADESRRVVCVPGHADRALATCSASRRQLQGLGVTVATGVELVLQTAAGTSVVEVAATLAAAGAWVPGNHDGSAGAGAQEPGTEANEPLAPATELAATEAPWAGLRAPDPANAWQQGVDRLADPGTARRFLTSRLLYRRFARFAWWLLVPYAVVILLGDPGFSAAVTHFLHGRLVSPHVLVRVRQARWGERLTAATVVAVVGLLVLGAVLAVIGRQAWSALGGGPLPAPWRRGADATEAANADGREAARALLAAGRAGLITGATPQAELTHLGAGFFACTGACGEVVEEHPGRLGLPPVFLARRQLAWVELETGAQLHARLLLAHDVEPGATLLERLAARRQTETGTGATVVAAFPQGASWPPAPDLQAVRRRSRRARRWGAAVLAVAGAADLLSAVTPPLRSRLHVVLQLLPLGVSQAAGVLVALAGVALLALARGVRRGQRRAWLVSVAVLATTVVLHAAHGGDVVALCIAAAGLAILLTHQQEFRAASDRPSLRTAVVAVVGGAVLATVAATIAVELSVHVDRDQSRTIPLWRAIQAVVERLGGVRTIELPKHIDGFLTPTLLAVGIMLVVVAVLLATRPVVERATHSGRAAELRARDVVRRHGQGTLDYFALRRDKQWFFYRDSLVAYGLYGGICLVSPDPIGPVSERAHVWSAFRRFADSNGWAVTVMGASEEWLPLYRATGMRDIYIGDEAVVDVQRFSLQGGHMKGLRQAYNRVARYGYTARFVDPARVPVEEAARLVGLLDQSRRGERERGFSMMLGRLFDRRDEGLLMCVVDGPDGVPVALCQFVPAQGIGGFSLDLMRRARGEHPNGLIDFALIATIEHLREQQLRGLSLNFAAMRSILEGERGDGLPVRVERWALERMSSFLQIETLWRFNAKYDPRWLPRYVAYDAAEHLVPSILAIVRAESLWEVPVLGRLIAAAERRKGGGHDDGTGAAGSGGRDTGRAASAAAGTEAPKPPDTSSVSAS